MKQNVMSVSAGVNVASVGIYEVDFNQKDRIDNVKILEYSDLDNVTIKEIAKIIKEKCKDLDVKYVVIDCRGVSVAVADTILMDDDINATIYRQYPTMNTTCYDLVRLNDLISGNKISKNNDIDIDLSEFKLIVKDKITCDVILKDTKYSKVFSNIALLVGNIEYNRKDTIKVNKKKTVEKNLTEILSILIDDLSKLNGLEKDKVDTLTRLIDKVNYIRGQY